MISEIYDILSMANKTIGTAIDYKGKVEAAINSNLVSATRMGRVEPICLLTSDLLNYEPIGSILSNSLNMFIGFYLQALAYATTVNKVQVGKILDKFNPDRSLSIYTSGNESYQSKTNRLNSHKYSNTDKYKYRLPTISNIGLEADEESAKTVNIMDSYNKGDLMVGKTINVSVLIDGKNITLPVTFNLQVGPIKPFVMDQILQTGKTDSTLSELLHDYKSGRKSLKDIIFATEAIKAHKKALLLDDTGAYREIHNRVNNSVKVTMASGVASLNTSSSIFVFSTEVAKSLERKLGIELTKDFVQRQKIFDTVKAMIMVEVDTAFDVVRIYHNGIKLSTQVSIKDIKASKKEKVGADLTDVISSLMKGKPPSFI